MASDDIARVRKRPGMYCGGSDAAAVHVLFLEVLSNAVREQLTGHGSRVDVVLDSDGTCRVRDDGRGIAVESSRGMPMLQLVLTSLSACGFDERPKIPGAKYGIGLCVVNALSERFSAQTRRNGLVHEIRFCRGALEAPLAALSSTDRTGTEISFVPDSSIFGDSTFDAALMARSIDAIRAVHPQVTIAFTDARDR